MRRNRRSVGTAASRPSRAPDHNRTDLPPSRSTHRGHAVAIVAARSVRAWAGDGSVTPGRDRRPRTAARACAARRSPRSPRSRLAEPGPIEQVVAGLAEPSRALSPTGRRGVGRRPSLGPGQSALGQHHGARVGRVGPDVGHPDAVDPDRGHASDLLGRDGRARTQWCPRRSRRAPGRRSSPPVPRSPARHPRRPPAARPRRDRCRRSSTRRA